MTLERTRTALILVDVQQVFLEWEAGGMRRNNPGAVGNIAALLAAFRREGMAVFHVRHASRKAGSAFNPENPGYAPMDEAREAGGEPVIVKHVNSAFIGTDLEAQLRARDIGTLVIAGITTNHCVETTTRMAGNLGFDARLVSDACYTFDRTGFDGRTESAETIHAMTLSNLNGEFATIETTENLLAALNASAAA
ncbi:cysteine hydrolase family protein [Oricola thermophila]|uniref:Cysteine hydrolase n=1 Tax=Oricola thermophila TaxID=2742145 RepID=A0A6N1VJE1_9HYPH|nr:cysteine hydrolase family protein [Oricola thermophila]QKV19339.1 cysteine hydrolase [Oricola thermophila]